jgi:pyruvate dehydrogenase E1 component alpha subunit
MPICECRLNDNINNVGHTCEITNYRIDGNDVLSVYETAIKAVDLCKKGMGPVFIECTTYRLRGHVGPDDNIQGTHTDIRPEEEVLNWKKKDPIVRLKDHILSNDITGQMELDEIKSDIEKVLSEAYQYAQSSPYPQPNELMNYVFK